MSTHDPLSAAQLSLVAGGINWEEVARESATGAITCGNYGMTAGAITGGVVGAVGGEGLASIPLALAGAWKGAQLGGWIGTGVGLGLGAAHAMYRTWNE